TMPAGNQPRRLDLQHLQKPRSARGSNLQPFAFSCNHQTVILQGLRKGQTNLAVFGSIRLGSLFLTLPTRGLTGRRVFGSGPWMTPGDLPTVEMLDADIHRMDVGCRAKGSGHPRRGGTERSNPAPSSGESANHRFLGVRPCSGRPSMMDQTPSSP